MKRLGLLVLAASIVLLALSPVAAGFSSRTLAVTVYSDGYVHVDQTFSVDPRATSVQVPLLSTAVSDLVATDQAGSPLSYSFGSGGSNITVYTLGASSLTLAYDTSSLTLKNGTIWTLEFDTAYNSTVILPPLSTLSSASGTPYTAPYTINETGKSPELTLPPGYWNLSYGVPFGGTTSTGTSSVTPPNSPLAGLSGAEVVVGGLVAAAVGGGVLLLRRRRGGLPNAQGLRPDDVQVLGFIREKGGKVLEPEIRTRFALPKTSAWRQIKRLERLGYVRVTKVGSQNQIELVKERSPEG